MNKTELIDAIAASHPDVSRAETGRIVGTIIEAIGNEIRRGRKVQIRGFGTFSTSKQKARMRHNRTTGEPIKKAATTLPKFSAAKTLKDLLGKTR